MEVRGQLIKLDLLLPGDWIKFQSWQQVPFPWGYFAAQILKVNFLDFV